MIEVEDLRKSYGDFEALTGVSFRVQKGEVLGLLGPNGAGKTTVMKIIATLIAPTSGKVRIDGYDVCSSADFVRKQIGYLPENPALYHEMTVMQYLKFIGTIKGVNAKELNKKVDAIVHRCLLSGVVLKLCGELSKGYKQRVGLAQALLSDPEVIILDEPTSGLDPAQIIDIRKLIKDLAVKHTVILSTHILSEVRQTCSSFAVIATGRIVKSGEMAGFQSDGELERVYMDVVSRGGI